MVQPVTRPATVADIPAITAIYAHAVQHGTATFEIDPPRESEMADRFRALAEAGLPYLVAEHDGEIRVGFKFGRWLDTVLMQRPLGLGATTPP
jgi:L-amino acid N-acyltransferase YncA